MGIVPSPLSRYVPPSARVRTISDANVSNVTAGLRIPCEIGVGTEELSQTDYSLVRGSSSTVDQQVTREDVSDRFVVDSTNPSIPILGNHAGTYAKFRVRNYPIADGQGIGRTTNEASAVSVTVNGDVVATAVVVGADGYITLQVPPPAGANVRCTYYMHRRDTVFLDTVSDQVTQTTASLLAGVAGAYAIIADTTDTFIVEVDGTESTVVFPAGSQSATALKAVIDAEAISGLSVSAFTDAQGGSRLQLDAAKSLVIGAGTANAVLGFTAGQASDRTVDFQVFQRPIVDGTDGGITTTDTSKVVAKVNGVQVIPTAVDGTNGIVTLPYAPSAGSTVTIQYWSNTWQDTYDMLPNTGITSITRCGFAPGRSDYLPGTDLVFQNDEESQTSVVRWGASYAVTAGTSAPGSESFDSTQILPTLVDDRWYMAECERFVDTTVVPSVVSTNTFILPAVPTTGNGRDTPLGSSLYSDVTNSRMGLNTNRPDLVVVYAGHSVQDALSRDPITVQQVDSSTLHIVLTEEVPPDHTVYATFWYSRLSDNTYSLKSKVAGASGVGQYEIVDAATGSLLHQVRFGVKSGLSDTVQWPRGSEIVPDAFHTGDGTPVAETVTVTFAAGTAKNAAFTVPNAAPWLFYASQSDQFRSTINGVSFVTDLDTATKGALVSDRVVGSINITTSNNTLALTIDGQDVDVTITTGSPRTPAQIVTNINAAIDAHASFSGTAPNTLASTITIAGDAVFIIRSYSTPAALPGGFDHAATVSIRQGTAEGTLGFSTFQSASGTPTATVKPATLLGTEASTFEIVAGVNDELVFKHDGTEFTVVLTAGATVSAATLVTDINTEVGATVASAGTLGNLNHIRLTSTTTGATSSIEIMGGSANDTLGFTEGDIATATAVTAEELAAAIMATSGFTAEGFAYVSEFEGSEYVTIESDTTGSSASTIAFASGSASAFNTLSGTGIVVGTSGDNGEDATNTFAVTSSHASGSTGTGVPGQTFTADATGLRFTVLEAEDGAYTTSGSFTLIVSPTFVANAAVPSLAVGGLELIVSDTVGVTANNTASLQTFDSNGLEPVVGDIYYISYKYAKENYEARLFQKSKLIEANYGAITAENRLSLGAYLLILNGAVLVAVKQIRKVPNTNQASDASFTAALLELESPLTGNIQPDLMLPLGTTTSIYQNLLFHVEKMSQLETQAERMGFIGFATGTSASNVQTVARSLKSNRIVAVFPSTGVVILTDEAQQTYEALIDSSIMMCTLGGAVVSPSRDVATPYTRMRVLGIDRIQQILDEPTLNQTAVAGVTILEDLSAYIRVRHGLTTNMDTVLSRIPSVTQIADSIHIQTRGTLDPFVGTKFLASRVNEVEVSLTGMLKANKQGEIIGDFQGVSAEVHPDNPTAMLIEAYYAPIFPLEYLVVTYGVRSSF